MYREKISRVFDLEGSVAIVTGAGQGIGKGIALALAESGADLVIADYNPVTSQDTANEIRQMGRRALALPTDMRESEQVENLVSETMEEYGAVDILVNNAGGIPSDMNRFSVPVVKMTDEGWDSIVRLNLRTTFLGCRSVGRVMIQQKSGSIINISSIAALGSMSNGAHYAAAKAGVIALTQTLAFELGNYRVRVNAIAPGLIESPGSDERAAQSPQIRQRRIEKTPLGRIGNPRDIGTVVVFLASNASDFITGQTIPVTGGLDSLEVA